MNEIINYLNVLYPNPKCELNYSNDYELLIAVMLSAQSTDKMVNKVTKVLFDKYKSIEELNYASIEDITDIIKPVGNQNKKAIYIKNIAAYLLNHKIYNRNDLESIKGVGRKTSNLVLGILYDMPYMPVDTHVKRVSKRLGLVNESDSINIIENKLEQLKKYTNINKLHLQLVLFGRYKCKSINPLCMDCKFKSICKKS